MTALQYVGIVVIILSFSILAFIFGWNLAVSKWRKGREHIMLNLARLESQVNEFNVSRELDPQRGWTDVGTQYAISRMKNTIRELTEEIEKRSDAQKDPFRVSDN